LHKSNWQDEARGLQTGNVKSNSITEFESRPELLEMPNAVREALSKEMVGALAENYHGGMATHLCEGRIYELVEQCLIRGVARPAGKLSGRDDLHFTLQEQFGSKGWNNLFPYRPEGTPSITE